MLPTTLEEPLKHCGAHPCFATRKGRLVDSFNNILQPQLDEATIASYMQYVSVSMDHVFLTAIQYTKSMYLTFGELNHLSPESYINDNIINALWCAFEKQLLVYHERMKSKDDSIPMCITSTFMWSGLVEKSLVVTTDYDTNDTKRSLRQKKSRAVNFDKNFEVFQQTVANNVWTKEVVFIPYCINNMHWILFVLNFHTFEYDVWDSLYSTFKNDHNNAWKNIERYFVAKYKFDNNGDTFPFKFKKVKASSTYSPGPQQPAISNDCALYVVWNMVWISFELHTPMLHNTHCGNITKKLRNSIKIV